ncbi:MAG TPA: GH92 family glycosyl hydrolase [Saprospiraceae bacterium]|nr:GH92 family glycosyl hydrolase [Saprospiraceae bacterium]HMQ82262.1 GH92 family glycosyl hydrolase [Saprospiraceae bacterium]
MPSYTLSLLALICLLLGCADAPSNTSQDENRLVYVDPFIGTAAHGHVYPGATVPFGAVQVSPDNGTPGWDWCSGYNYADSIIIGFSHLHLSGTGIGDLYDISVMPAVQAIDFQQRWDDRRAAPYAATFAHQREKAAPGYYQVALNNGIQVELTASRHCGYQRYQFPEKGEKVVLVDLGFALNWDAPVASSLHYDEQSGILKGYRRSKGWARDQQVHFAMRFSEKPSTLLMADSTQLLKGNQQQGKRLRVQLVFPQTTQTLQIITGISSANQAGADAALAQVENKLFDDIRTEAETLWQAELSKIKVVGIDSLKKIFYTALYHTCLAPVVYSDPNSNYKGCDTLVHQAMGYTRYDIFSLWDTFRAAHPLFTITQKDKVNDFIRSFIAHYEEYGLLPVWSLLGNETNTMTGYHAIPIIVDAYQKGFRDYDVEKAYAAMKASAMQNIRGTNFYREFGFIPYDKDGESVTKTLEYAYDDWCIAQMAKALGHQEDYQLFTKRAEAYKHLFDPATGFMRAKYSNGQWKTPFDPQYSDHNFDVAEYTEGNAWQHSWFVPHDVPGLIELHGGKAAFVLKLDSLFSISSEIKGENASADISGLIGQYAHGNEPSHHIVYMYNVSGHAWKTQQQVRNILLTQYNSQPDGLCGNEDCGQMSAWYVFSAMGFYPMNPADGKYWMGSPLFEEVVIPLENGKTFTVKAKNAAPEHPYILSASLNKKSLKQPYISHAEIMAGGLLELEMGANPNTELWASLD